MGTGTGETSGSPGSGQPQPGSALHRLPGTRRRQRPGRRWPNGGASAKARKERKSPAERTKALPKHSPEERGDAPDDAAAARPKPRSGAGLRERTPRPPGPQPAPCPATPVGSGEGGGGAGGGEQTGACAGKQWPPGLPALLAQGRRLTREGAAAAHTAAPGDTNKPEGSGQLLRPFLSRAPGALTSLPAQAPAALTPETGTQNGTTSRKQEPLNLVTTA